MQRYPDWPSRLINELQAASERPFSWGSHDCALFACNVVNAITGTDPAAIFRGTYSSEIGALRMIASYGSLAGLAEWVAHEHNCDEVPPAMAQRGDVLLIDAGAQGFALGICAGERAAVASPQGLSFVPMARVTRAWATGR